MKKIFIAFLAIITLSSCSNNSESENNIIIRASGNISQSETVVFKNPREYYTRDLTMDSTLDLAEKKYEIENLLAEYREVRFSDLLESRVIRCRSMFPLPRIITPTDILGGLEKSLYESEAAVNNTERKVIEEIAALPNVKWWHRIAERKPYSFCINGFINHYPDFFIMTEKGTLVVVEVKGDDRDNSDSEMKLRLGRKWADKAGDEYRYYMVFDKLGWCKEGAYDLADFIRLMAHL